MLNNTNILYMSFILYVFNPILLTSVFAADLQWSNSIEKQNTKMTLDKHNICVSFF